VGAAGAVQRNVAGSWLTFGVEEETVWVVLAPAEKSGVIVPAQLSTTGIIVELQTFVDLGLYQLVMPR
jgi:hypothetical protein